MGIKYITLVSPSPGTTDSILRFRPRGRGHPETKPCMTTGVDSSSMASERRHHPPERTNTGRRRWCAMPLPGRQNEANQTDDSPADARRPACPACGEPDQWHHTRYRKTGLVRCRACDLTFASRLPSQEQLDDHYARYPAIGAVSNLTRRRYREILHELYAFRQTGRLLDIGCGDGHFLKTARDQGWKAYGSEMGPQAVERCRAQGLDVRPAPFLPEPGEPDSFDVVTAFEVLEHVLEPRRELERMLALLRPGGCLYLTTPNFASLTRRVLGERWSVLQYPEHLNYFSPTTLDRLLSNMGLRQIYVRTTGVSPYAYLSAIGRIHHQLTRTGVGTGVDQRLRAGIEQRSTTDSAVRDVNRLLSLLRLGETIKALYRL